MFFSIRQGLEIAYFSFCYSSQPKPEAEYSRERRHAAV
jgi:hypothetical protein